MTLVVANRVLVDASLSVLGPHAWRLALDVDGKWRQARPIDCCREGDAERAKGALEQPGLSSAVALRRAGQVAVLRIMVESLAW